MSPWAGPSVLTPEHLRAMKRVLERELPGYASSDPHPDPEPLPIWVPPTFEPVSRHESCPNCGEALAISRIDLTANASWLQCQACNRRWGGAIEVATSFSYQRQP